MLYLIIPQYSRRLEEEKLHEDFAHRLPIFYLGIYG